jgi:hypothetical protein
MAKLTWDDLLVQGFTAEESGAWLSPWASVVSGRVAPEFLSRFGFWFLRRPEGHVDMLDVFSGTLERCAATNEEFVQLVNEPWWQEAYLLSDLVAELHDVGKVPGPRQCYSLAPHPALGGPNPLLGDSIDAKFVMVMDMVVWQSLCAQSLGLAR